MSTISTIIRQHLLRAHAAARRRQAFEDGSGRAEANTDLYTELRAALLEDPTRKVMAPAFGTMNDYTAVDIIRDDESTPGSTVLLELLGFVAQLAKAGDSAAQAWINAAAQRHADFHAADLVQERVDCHDDADLEEDAP